MILCWHLRCSITNEIVVQQLYQFVAEGGTVVLTNRCGVKDMYNKCQMDLLPTVYRELVGVHVEEYDVIGTVIQDVCIQDDELRQSFEYRHGRCSGKGSR